MSPRQPIKFYRFRLSGHSHRVEMFLSMLGLPTEIIDVDLRKSQHKTPGFLALNRFGQVPVIDDDGVVIDCRPRATGPGRRNRPVSQFREPEFCSPIVARSDEKRFLIL